MEWNDYITLTICLLGFFGGVIGGYIRIIQKLNTVHRDQEKLLKEFEELEKRVNEMAQGLVKVETEVKNIKDLK